MPGKHLVYLRASGRGRSRSGHRRGARIVTAHDVGTVINPIAHQGQIDGATIMGMGQGIMEELVIYNGRITNNNLGDYKLPSFADIPKLKTVLVKFTGGHRQRYRRCSGRTFVRTAADAG